MGPASVCGHAAAVPGHARPTGRDRAASREPADTHLVGSTEHRRHIRRQARRRDPRLLWRAPVIVARVTYPTAATPLQPLSSGFAATPFPVRSRGMASRCCWSASPEAAVPSWSAVAAWARARIRRPTLSLGESQPTTRKAGSGSVRSGEDCGASAAARARAACTASRSVVWSIRATTRARAAAPPAAAPHARRRNCAR